MEDHSEECEESPEGERIADEHKPTHAEARVRPYVEAVVGQGGPPLLTWQAMAYNAMMAGSKAITNADAYSSRRHNLGRDKGSSRAQYLEKRLSRAFGRRFEIGKYPRAAPGRRGASGAAVGTQGRGGGRKGGAVDWNQRIKDLIGASYKRKLRWSDIARYSSPDMSFPHAL